MKTSRHLAFAAALLLSAGTLAAQDINAEIRALLDKQTAAIKAEKLEDILSLLHPEYPANLSVPVQKIRESLEYQFATYDFKEVNITVTEVLKTTDPAVVRLHEVYTGTKSGQPWSETKDSVVLLKHQDGALRFAYEVQDVDPKAVDRATQSFVSKNGGFSVQYPEGWVPSKLPAPLSGLVIDGLSAAQPDLSGSFIVGVVQLPMKLEPAAAAKMSAQADASAMRSLSTEYRLIEEGEITRAGMPGWRVISEFDFGGEHRKRSQMYFGNESLVYFIICDIMGKVTPEAEQKLRSEFGAALDSFKLVPLDPSVSVAQQVRSENAEGTISGSVYTSSKYKCFIAAPPGWTIRTSSNPATLAEMQRVGGSSIIRLIAAEGIPDTMSAEKIFSDRIDSVKAVVKNFVETSRGRVTTSAGEGWQSVQSYSLDGLGDFGVKEVTIVKNGRYYLVLCQAISPDKYANLEGDFNQAIASFGLLP
jgi:hypothetical protein